VEPKTLVARNRRSVRGSRTSGGSPFLLVCGAGLIASAAALASVRPRGLAKAFGRKARSGFNCCEFCGAPLPRHPEQSWRYDGTCASCGRAQTWAPKAQARSEHAADRP
jgi:hypothetical protein